MDIANELLRAKEELNTQREGDYSVALNGTNIFEVSTDKFVTIDNGVSRLWSLTTAYDSMFLDLETPETEGSVKQADGSLVVCTQAEWDTLFILMRAKGRELFIKNEILIAMIDALTEDNTMDEVWNTTYENVVIPS